MKTRNEQSPSFIRRAVDRRGLVQFASATCACALLGGAGLFHAHVRTRVTEEGYRLSRLSAEQQKLLRERDRLTLQAAQLLRPARIEELAREWPGHLPLIDTLRSQYVHRATHLDDARLAGDGSTDAVRDAAAEQELVEHRLIRRAVIDAERGAVLRLRGRGAINDEVWRRIERDLDFEELRMEA